MSPRHTLWILLLAFLAGLGLFSPQNIRAAGSEFNFSGADLQIALNTKWTGCREGGYYPLRIQTRNLGPQRTITFEFHTKASTGSRMAIPTVTRDVTIEQNATVQTTLLIPVVSFGTYGEFRVLQAGRQIKNMSQTINLPEINNTGQKMPNMLIVSSTVVDGQFFSQMWSSAPGGYSPYSSYSGGTVECTETVTPTSLPTTWVAYTGLDLLAISWDNFEKKISPEARQAILQWVAAGGRLLVYNVENHQPALDQLLGWDQRAHSQTTWDQAKPPRFRVIHLTDPADSTRTIPESIPENAAWKTTRDTFAIRGLGLGQVIRMTADPFPGSVSHWTWLFGHLDGDTISWGRRHGINARTGNTTFLQFLIPGVGGVPVFSFLILITLFTLVIGPLNYGYFLKKKRLSMLLVTVPVLAIGSSLLLLGYSTIANGFSTKSRIRSLTLIDQKQNSSLSISRAAYFSGMAPINGMAFSPNTAVFPIWATENAFETGRVNWSDSQLFQNGWLRSRTRTQFLILNQREQRGRLEIKPGSESPQLSNGLEWTLSQLLLKDAQGNLWAAQNVRPGAVVALTPADAKTRGEFRTAITADEIGLPEGLSQQQAEQIIVNSSHNYYYYGSGSNYQDHYRNSQQEKLIRQMQLTTENDQNSMPASSYYAVLDQSPDLDLGLSSTQQRASQHLLIGFLD